MSARLVEYEIQIYSKARSGQPKTKDDSSMLYFSPKKGAGSHVDVRRVNVTCRQTNACVYPEKQTSPSPRPMTPPRLQTSQAMPTHRLMPTRYGV